MILREFAKSKEEDMARTTSPTKVRENGTNRVFYAYKRPNGYAIRSWDGRRVGQIEAHVTKKHLKENFTQVD